MVGMNEQAEANVAPFSPTVALSGGFVEDIDVCEKKQSKDKRGLTRIILSQIKLNFVKIK